jgi:aspartate aminotransferase-like enzyme
LTRGLSEQGPPLLMTPGPTRVPERVLGAGARPMLHHRSREFSVELTTLLKLLAPLFGTTSRVLPIHTTGRGATEAAICNLFSPGDQLAVCCNGKFGEMWATLAESYGLVVHRVSTDWARDVDPIDVDELVRRRPGIRAVALTYCDSSTGVANDIEAVCRAVKDRGTLVLVDAVSALGGIPFAFDAWGVDVAITASQKCLMSSPGLAFVAMSERAWAAGARARLPRNYWDFAKIAQHVAKSHPETPGTTPVHLVLQVAEALRQIHEEGLEQVYRRHDDMAARLRRGLAALGLSGQCPELRRLSSTLTAVALPSGMPPDVIREGLRARGILTAAGLGRYETSAFRIGHMGDVRFADVDRTLAALTDVLQ